MDMLYQYADENVLEEGTKITWEYMSWSDFAE